MTQPSLHSLEQHDAFVARHIGPNDTEIAEMLAALGFDSLDAFTQAIVPDSIKASGTLSLPDAVSEVDALARIRDIASRNQAYRSFIGQGYYGTHTPNVILRNILENPAWYTAYTPYQAEISQGRMEALINFQTMVADLTAMDIANASLLDEASAAAEAMTLAKRSSKSKSNTLLVSGDTHPQTLDVLRTRAEPLGLVVDVVHSTDEFHAKLATGDYFGVLVSYPASSGWIADWMHDAEVIHGHGALLVVASDLLALTLLKPPGEMGADIVVGSSQRFGVPMGFGGPHAAFMACRDAYKRSMPGRLIGVSIDAAGNPAYRLTLQTREQHIRREKATSNICTAQVLLAVMASMYAVYHGPHGLKRIAQRIARYTAILKVGLEQLGHATVHANAFDTLCIDTGDQGAALSSRARAHGINLRTRGNGSLCISLDETTTRSDIELLWEVFGEGKPLPSVDALESDAPDLIPEALRRTSRYLTHPVFNTHHSEHELLRYLRQLADKDLAMDRTMIPLGSCTMKLNATAEMVPVTWPEFANLHPLAPAAQARGYGELIAGLEAMLEEITGYDAVSLQPNSGAQGEYAGLLAIRAFHASRGEGHRNICLIKCTDGGHAGGGHPVRRQRQCRRRRHPPTSRKALGQPGRDHADLPIHPRRVRGRRGRNMRHRPQSRWPGLHRRRQHERIGWVGQARQVGFGCVAPEPAQDLLHPSRRRRPGCRSVRGEGSPRAVPPRCTQPRRTAHARGRWRSDGRRRNLRQCLDPADQLDVHHPDGCQRPAQGDPGGDAQCQLHRQATGILLPHLVHRPQRSGGARMHPRPAPAGEALRDQRRRRGQAPDRFRLPRPDAELPGCRHLDG